MAATHHVTNQPPPLLDYNLYSTDRALMDAAAREGKGLATSELISLGARMGSAEVIEWGFLANRFPPTLHTHDRTGKRRDEVEYHPSWHELLELGIASGLHTGPWAAPGPGAHVARAAGLFMLVQVEAGVMCPLTTSYAAVPALRAQPEVAAEWIPRLLSRRYDRRFLPVDQKTGALVSMGMTEKQGGTDLRTNTTRALPVGAREYLLTGHKWFFSIPMCDAFLVTAQTAGGLSCFLLPRFLPDGTVNGLHLQRLKDKLGNRANASSEVEFRDAWAVMVGEEGRGVQTILEMVNYTRLDCALGSAAQMRQAVTQAVYHATHRRVFKRALVDQPLMTNVLADLALESEAATALTMRLAGAYDRQDDPDEVRLRRILTPAVKYWSCKRAPALCAEALEVHGGSGYVEECIMPRLYREAPLNSVWEGCGNVMCLDVLRALARTPGATEVVLGELEAARGADTRLDQHIAALTTELATGRSERDGRRLVERLVLALEGALLVRHAPAAVADAFCASRLAAGWSGSFGTLPSGVDVRAIVDRARPC